MNGRPHENGAARFLDFLGAKGARGYSHFNRLITKIAKNMTAFTTFENSFSDNLSIILLCPLGLGLKIG